MGQGQAKPQQQQTGLTLFGAPVVNATKATNAAAVASANATKAANAAQVAQQNATVAANAAKAANAAAASANSAVPAPAAAPVVGGRRRYMSPRSRRLSRRNRKSRTRRHR